jgi:hypothetical protein
MPRVIDAGLERLHQHLQTIPLATVKREPDKPITLTTAGAVLLFDGDGQVEDESLSPRTYHWRWVALIEIRASGTGRRATTDGLLSAIATLISGDPTMGGAVDYAEMEPLTDIAEDPVEGNHTERQALVPVAFYFATTDALGFTRA